MQRLKLWRSLSQDHAGIAGTSRSSYGPWGRTQGATGVLGTGGTAQPRCLHERVLWDPLGAQRCWYGSAPLSGASRHTDVPVSRLCLSPQTEPGHQELSPWWAVAPHS